MTQTYQFPVSGRQVKVSIMKFRFMYLSSSPFTSSTLCPNIVSTHEPLTPVPLRLTLPVAARSKAWVCGRSPAEIVGSNPTGGMDVCRCECCVLLGIGLYDELITLPGEAYRLGRVVVCDLETS